MSDIVFIHQNFPAQFLNLQKFLSQRGIRNLAFKAKGNHFQFYESESDPAQVHEYSYTRASTPNIHPWAVDLESKVIRVHSLMNYVIQNRLHLLQPKIVIGHPGWGELFSVREIWPAAKLIGFCEFYYDDEMSDAHYDPEFTDHSSVSTIESRLITASTIKLKNLFLDKTLAEMDEGISPTVWQKSKFPQHFHHKINAIHEGVDTDMLAKYSSNAQPITIDDAQISPGDQILTFVSRNLEPYRGYHVLMRLAPLLLSRYPHLKIIIIGGTGKGYGPLPDPAKYGNKSWKDIFFEESFAQVDDQIKSRVKYLGNISHSDFLSVLSVSMLHVYYSYPFVVSWSLLEAMGMGLPIVCNDVESIGEICKDQENGLAANLFDLDRQFQNICTLLENADLRRTMAQRNKRVIREHYACHRNSERIYEQVLKKYL